MSKDWKELDAGRELDAIVAEKVMGWEVVWHSDPNWKGMRQPFRVTVRAESEVSPLLDRTREQMLPRFSKSMDAAWQVVDTMRLCPSIQYRSIQLVAWCYNRTYATFDADAFTDHDDATWAEANGEHATPLAICRAALMVMESAAEERQHG